VSFVLFYFLIEWGTRLEAKSNIGLDVVE
jgi:hypothetical protein